MITKKDATTDIPFFCGLHSEEIQFFKHFLSEKIYEEGEVIIKQGTRVKNLILIQEGRVSISVFLPGCIEKIIAHLENNQVIGEVAFISNTLATATVIAEKKCKGLICSHTVLSMLRIVRPEIAFKIEQEISKLLVTKIIQNINLIISLYKRIKKGVYQSNLLTVISENVVPKILTAKELNPSRLKKINFFNELEKEYINTILPIFKVKEYPKGFLFSPDTIGKIMVIYSGTVLYFINTPSFKKTIAICGIGDLFIQGFPDEELSNIIAFATYEKTITLELDYELLKQLKITHPKFFYLINKHMNIMLANSVYIINREFIRVNSEYNNII